MTNKFVSVLETIGKDALAVVGAAKSTAGQEVITIAEDFVPGLKPVVDIVSKIGTLVQGAEATAAVLKNGLSGTGAQKLAAIIPLVAKEVLASELMLGKVVDQNLFNQGVTDLTNGVVEIYNSLVAAAPAATAQPAPAAAAAQPQPEEIPAN